MLITNKKLFIMLNHLIGTPFPTLVKMKFNLMNYPTEDYLHSLWGRNLVFKGNEDVARFDIKMNQLFTVYILQPLGNVPKDPSKLCLRKSYTCSPILLNFSLETSSFTILILDVNLKKDKLSILLKVQ